MVILSMFIGFAACSIALTFLSWFKFKATIGDWGEKPLENQVLEDKVNFYF